MNDDFRGEESKVRVIPNDFVIEDDFNVISTHTDLVPYEGVMLGLTLILP